MASLCAPFLGNGEKFANAKGPTAIERKSMPVRIRMKRIGAKNAPVFRIVVADGRSPRDGKFIEEIGTYWPEKKSDNVKLKLDRANYWVSKGAQPSDTVRSLLRRAGVLKRRHEQRLGIELKAAAVPVRETSEEETPSESSEA